MLPSAFSCHDVLWGAPRNAVERAEANTGTPEPRQSAPLCNLLASALCHSHRELADEQSPLEDQSFQHLGADNNYKYSSFFVNKIRRRSLHI